MATQTPWGKADQVKHITRGIRQVMTPSHGGYMLSPKKNEKVPLAWRQASFGKNGMKGNYEEDCDWVLVVLTFPELFSPGTTQSATECFPVFFPELAYAETLRKQQKEIYK